MGSLARRCLRQRHRWEEYNPSRLSKVPISPGSVQASASRRTLSLYSAANRRRVTFAMTSPPRCRLSRTTAELCALILRIPSRPAL